MSQHAPAEIYDLASKIGDFIQYWGFKKIHGQIWSFIFLAKEPVDSTTLVKQLNVSKALVSLAIKDLRKHNIIRIVDKGRGRKIYFETNPDLMSAIAEILRSREKKLITAIKESYLRVISSDTVKTQMAIDEMKLKQLGDMLEFASESLDAMISSNLDIVVEPVDKP